MEQRERGEGREIIGEERGKKEGTLGKMIRREREICRSTMYYSYFSLQKIKKRKEKKKKTNY